MANHILAFLPKSAAQHLASQILGSRIESGQPRGNMGKLVLPLKGEIRHTTGELDERVSSLVRRESGLKEQGRAK